ncbi:unnamed protein product, partial [Mesorhabditis spiculigera]
MHFLTLLALAAVFGATVANLQCYSDYNANGFQHTSSKTKQTCGDGCKFCKKTYSQLGGINAAEWGCGCDATGQSFEICTEKGKFDRSPNNNNQVELNCCTGNLCNAAERSSLFTVLTTVCSALAVALMK